MPALWRAAVEQLEQGNDFVTATIISVRGSSPRHVGTRFIVRRDGVIVGTIGGGIFEAAVRDFAVKALENRSSHRAFFAFRGEDVESNQMICGGDTEVLVEFVDADDATKRAVFNELLKVVEAREKARFVTYADIPQGGTGTVHHLLLNERNRVGSIPNEDEVIRSIPEERLLQPAQALPLTGPEAAVFCEFVRPRGTVIIFGAGHVGQCVAHLARYVGFTVVVLDDREDFACADMVPDAHETRVLDSFDRAFDGIQVDDDAYIVIVTRGHAHDKTVLGQALRTPAGYVGMIGSKRKNAIIFQALLNEGFTQSDLNRVNAPIGLPIGGETPQEIGLSIVGKLIEMRSARDRIRRPIG